MEAKLKEYRAIRRRKELIEKTRKKYEESKEKIVNFIVPKVMLNVKLTKEDIDHLDKLYPDDEEVMLLERQPIQPIQHINDEAPEASVVEIPEEEDTATSLALLVVSWFTYLMVWMVFWAFFIYLQFGAVYFVITVLVGMYFNTRTRPKLDGEVSAYSVFNKNCASIKGALTPEQFEREIRYGPGIIRNH